MWCPILGPVFGTLFGALTYDLLIYTGGDSIVNKRWVLNYYPSTRLVKSTDYGVYRDGRTTKRHLGARAQQREKLAVDTNDA